MTLILELPIELETALASEAKSRGVAVETLAIERLRAPLNAKPRTIDDVKTERDLRRAAIDAGFGSLQGVLNSDEFLAERHDEAERELEKSATGRWPSNPFKNGRGS